MNKDKSAGKLMPSFREIELYRKRFEEGANLQGRSGLLYQIDSEKQINTDEYYQYKAPVNVSYYLVENPKKSVLLKLGWFSEDTDSKPILCYLTYLDSDRNKIYPSEGAILEISSRMNPHEKEYQTIKFDIVKVQTDFELAMFICNLAPHREQLKPVHPMQTPEDMINENRFLNRKLLGENDLK